MHGPAVVSWLLVAMCGATGVYCLAAARGPGHARGTALTEAAMGLAMAAMAVPGAAGGAPAAVFTALFTALAVWSVWSLRTAHHRRHGLHHALEALAMAYMALVMASGGGHHAGHGAGHGGIPLVTGALLVYFAGFALYTGSRALPSAVAVSAAPGAAGSGERGSGVPPAAGVADACRLTLALGSFTMLLAL